MPACGRTSPDHPSRRPRNEALDVLRGVAILGIFTINIPAMGGPVAPQPAALIDPSWSDQAVSWLLDLLVADTQRGLLQLLFGAGVMLLTAGALRPGGTAAGYYRRTLWLLVFGLVHVFALLWPYDILHIYALAALCLYPLRRIGPKAALTLALGVNLLVMASVGTVQSEPRHAEPGHPHEASAPEVKPDPEKMTASRAAAEREARQGGYLATAQWSIRVWSGMYDGEGLWWRFADSFATMLIGMALFGWGILQGLRSRRFYLALAVAAYAVGLPLRLSDAFGLPVGWASAGLFITARLAITIGHVAVINLLLHSRAGETLLRPFRAVGRTAFSLYLMQTGIGMGLLFPAWGLGLWGRFGPAGLTLIATGVAIVQILLANLWLRVFSMGPVEWAWRSLAAWRRQPFRLQAAGAARS